MDRRAGHLWIAAAVACSSADQAIDTDVGSTTSSACVVAAVGCECTPGGGCDPGLECVVGVCIPEDVGTSSAADTTEPDTSATASTSTSDSSTGPAESGTSTSTTSSSGGSSEGVVSNDCGNGRLDDGETCDDGNVEDGDGCNADCLPGGQEIWTVVQDGGVQANDYATRVAIDAADDIYFVGVGYGVLANDLDGYVMKHDDDGQLVWTDRFIGGDIGRNDGFWGVAVAPDQTLVVSGFSTNAGNVADGVVRKYSADGDVLWTHLEPDVSDAIGYDLAVDSLGDIVVTGLAHDDLGAPRTWLAKFDPDGDIIWNYRLDVGGPAGTIAMGIDSADAIVIAGANGFAYVTKFDADGAEIWAYSALVGNDSTFGLTIDPDDGIFTAGTHGNPIQAQLAHYGADGVDPDWTESWPGDYGGSASAQDVAVDSVGRPVSVGVESSVLGDVYMFARKLDGQGDEAWVHDIAGNPPGVDVAYGVAVDSLDQVVMVGRRRGDDGDDDFFMRKLTP